MPTSGSAHRRLVYRHGSSRYSTVHLVFDIFQGIGVATAVGIRPFLPGLVAGAITAFAASLGEFGAIITFVSNIPGETQTIPTAIYTFIQEPGGDLAAFRLTLVSIAISMAALIVSEPVAGSACASAGSSSGRT